MRYNFLIAVTSQIESIGGGWGVVSGLKQKFKKSSDVPSVSDSN